MKKTTKMKILICYHLLKIELFFIYMILFRLKEIRLLYIKMDKYKTIKLREKQQPMAHDTIVKMYRKDKKMLKEKDLEFILKELNKSNKNKKFTYLFRGRNKMRMTTLKGFEQKDFHDHDNDYYAGHNPEEFNQYYYLEIILRKSVNMLK